MDQADPGTGFLNQTKREETGGFPALVWILQRARTMRSVTRAPSRAARARQTTMGQLPITPKTVFQ